VETILTSSTLKQTDGAGYLIHGKDSVERKGGVWDCGYSLKTVQRGRQSSMATYLTLKFLYRPVPLLCTNPVNISENFKKSTLDSFQNKF
jgi:hypothetical protein